MRESYIGRVGSFPAYRGYTVNDYQEESVAGSVLGSTDMILGLFARPKPIITATQPLCGTITFAGSAGWQARIDAAGGRWGWDMFDGGGNLNSFEGQLYDPVIERPKWHLFVVRQFGNVTTDVELYVNGAPVGGGSTVASGATVAGASPFRVGFNSSFNDIADQCDIGAIAYFEGTVVQDNLQFGIDNAMKRRGFIADAINGINWSDIWIPRTGQGSVDCSYFTRQGAVVLSQVGASLARTSPPMIYA